MRRLPDLRVGQWLAIGFGAAAALLLVVGAVALVLLGRIADAERRRSDVVAPRAAAAARLEREVLGLSIAVRTYALVSEERQRLAFEAARERALQASAALDAIPKDPDALRLWAETADRVASFEREAASFAAGVGAPRDDLREREARLSEARESALARLAEYVALQERKLADVGARIGALQRRAAVMLSIALPFTLALLGATVLLVRRAVRTPVLALVEEARRLAAGERGDAGALAGRPGDPPPRNELAELKRAFGRMAFEIQDREERILAQNEELQTQNEELQAQNEELQAQREELEAQSDQLRETDRQKAEFLAVLSHELRNPLTPIVNAQHLLRRTDGWPDGSRRALAVLERQTGQLVRLVDDLLDATRISRGKVHLRRARVDLVRLVRQAVEDMASTFSARGIALDADVPRGRELWVVADAARISQVIGNLLANAAKFTPHGGRVSVSLAAADDGRAVLRVRDTGVGIPPEVLPRLFHPFVQSERSLARSRGGLGLGLSLVKALVELHGGAVRAASDGDGHGAEFTVELPLDGAGPGAVQVPVRAVGPRRRVLVVEDNVDAAETLADLLRGAGHEVDVAHRGAAALERVRSVTPDAVLCDIGLPEMDGYAVARAIRTDARLGGVFLVALSGYAQPEDVRLAREAGFDAQLTKPARLEDLEEILARARAREG